MFVPPYSVRIGSIVVLASCLLAVRASGHGGSHTTPDISKLLEPIRAAADIPGLVAVVVRGDHVIAQGAAGVRAKGTSKLVTTNDRFHLGSDTKAMTATMLAVLVEEGRLKWDSTIGEVFAGRVEPMDPGWSGVTLDQLLTHRGGAPADLQAGGLWERLWERKGTPTDQRMELVRGVLAQAPAAPAGTTFIYSNAGYAIAGAMAEAVTGKSWEDLMVEKLFKPLDITTAGFGAPGSPRTLVHPVGHDGNGNPVPAGPKADNPPAIAPAGAVHMSVTDWALFISLHLRGDPANPYSLPRLLQAPTFVHLHTPANGPGERYAAGWKVVEREWAKGTTPNSRGVALTHAGSNTMWYCVAWLAPERDYAVLIACNRFSPAAVKACDEIAITLNQKFNSPR